MKIYKTIFAVFVLVSAGVAAFSSNAAEVGKNQVNQKIVPKNIKVEVTSKNCAAGLEQLRLRGLKEMRSRRNAALAKAKKLGNAAARADAKKKAEAVYANEMKVAAKQMELAKKLCKEPPAVKKLPPTQTRLPDGQVAPKKR